MKLLRRTLVAVSILAFTFGLILYGNYITLPTHNTAAAHFDTIIVLGTPARLDGTPSPEQRERVLECVREYKAGIAPHIIMTGGAAHNNFVEAHVMAQFAASQGVPAAAIVEEPKAQNTIQNIYYSAELMHGQNWSSAEVVSSPYHLGRTELILNTLNTTKPVLSIDWKTHPALWPNEYNIGHKTILYTVEAWRCLKLRAQGIPPEQFPGK